MRGLLLASVSSLALATAAAAADRPVLPVKGPPPAALFNWQGLYVGINGGVARHEVDLAVSLAGPFTTGSLAKSGATFGGQIGANWQTNSLIYGVEADLNWLDVKGATITTTGGTASFTSRLAWLATVRARAGVLLAPPVLLYLMGGLAVGHVESEWFSSTIVEDKTRAGWTVGGGVEHMFAPNWTAKAEVLYVDLGTSTVSSGGYTGRFSHTAWLGRVGLNMKW